MPQVSTDGAKTWTSLWSWNSYSGNSAPWTREQLDLRPYAGLTNLAVRFGAFQAPPGWPFDLDFSVDDVVIAEQPEPDANVSATVAPGSDPRYDA